MLKRSRFSILPSFPYQYIPDTYMEYMKNRPYALTLFTCCGFNWDTGVWEQSVVVLADLAQMDFVNSVL